MKPKGFDAFAADVARHFGIEGVALSNETQFVDDLAMDSLQLFELVVLIEDMIGALLPQDLLDEIRTLGDADHWYTVKLGQSEDF